MNRNRLPTWANNLIDRIADAPMSPIGRLAARRLGKPAPAGTVSATEFDTARHRVIITPTNYSGQATAWARALEASDPEISARSAAVDVPGGFSFDADLVIPVPTYHNDPDWQRRQFEAACAATHVLIEAEEPPFGRMFGRSVEKQAAALLERGVDVAYLGHGTDVRLPSRHISNHEWSYYAHESVYAPRLEVLAARNIELLQRSNRPVFVSTPDLLLDLPDAVWCPVAVDLRRWHIERAEKDDGRPLRVLHSPSVGALKGTDLILPVVEKLVAEGVIEFELVQGVSSGRMPEVFARADVVIDQLRTGAYGVVACEAMAAGTVVVGQVTEQVRALIAERTGMELPVVEATPDSIESTLRYLASREDLADLRRQGREFVSIVHDGRLAAAALREHWIEPAATLSDPPPETEQGD